MLLHRAGREAGDVGVVVRGGREQAMEVVFVQARVAVDRRAFAAHPAQDRVDRLRVAVQRAADHAVECERLLREVFAEPDALLLARRGQPVVVVRAEGRLPMPYQK